MYLKTSLTHFSCFWNTFFIWTFYLKYYLKKCFYWPEVFFYKFCSCHCFRTTLLWNISSGECVKHLRLCQSLLPELPRITRKNGRFQPEENILKQYWHIFLGEKITSKCNKVYKVSFHFVLSRLLAGASCKVYRWSTKHSFAIFIQGFVTVSTEATYEQCFRFIYPENTRKPKVFLSFQGV